MEIPQIILSQALAKSNSSSIHVELKNVLQKLEIKKLEDFINADRNNEMLAIDNEIYNLIIKNIFYNSKPESEKIEIIAKIIDTVLDYLKKGISGGDVRAILIFLSVNIYIKLEIEKVLSKSELEEAHTESLSKKIIAILKSIKLETRSMPDAPYHEKEMMKESIEGFAQNNISKTYGLIEAIELGGRGFHFNFLLENLISFLYSLNYTHFIKALSYLQNPTEFVFYCQSLKKEALLKIANESTLSNKWLNFEIIRQIIEKEEKENIIELEVEALTKALKRISFNNFNFLKQTSIYFQRSILFNASLGDFLATTGNVQIEEIISDFTIDKYSSNLAARDKLREHFVKSASKQQFDLIHRLIFNKWKNYLDSILILEDFYQNNLLISDFVNFIVDYYTHLVTDNDLLSEIERLIDKIWFIDSEWTSSVSEQITKFHVYHSQIFLFTFAYRNKKLNTPQIQQKYANLISDKIQLSRYVSAETKTYFEEGKRNIDWVNETEI